MKRNEELYEYVINLLNEEERNDKIKYHTTNIKKTERKQKTMIERKEIKVHGISVKKIKDDKFIIKINYEREKETNEKVYGKIYEEGIIFRNQEPGNIEELINRECEILREKDKRTNYVNYILYIQTKENKE